jgi:hypothetical protein
LLEVGQQAGLPQGATGPLESGNELLIGLVKIQQGDNLLPNLIRTLGPSRRFTNCLNGGKEQAKQNSNHSQYYEQLDQRETAPRIFAANAAAGDRCLKEKGRQHGSP